MAYGAHHTLILPSHFGMILILIKKGDIIYKFSFFLLGLILLPLSYALALYRNKRMHGLVQQVYASLN